MNSRLRLYRGQPATGDRALDFQLLTLYWSVHEKAPTQTLHLLAGPNPPVGDCRGQSGQVVELRLYQTRYFILEGVCMDV